ncbi:protein NYNRIN-like [Haliotis cracherodii]|uniref:protein NYNRIN-like n=1 Tax=Haliotis cracherodii TaxID=6455 RepID=UPI0039EABA3F
MVIHRQGRKHLNADALSLNPCKACLRQEVEQELGDSSDEEGNQMVSEGSSPQADIFTEFNRAVTRSHMNQPSEPLVSLEGWTLPEIRQKQLADANVGILLAAKEEGKKPEWKEISHMSSTIKTLWRHWDRLNVYSGVLYRLWMEDDESRQQMIVPQSLKDDVLKYYHDIPSSAHLGREKTLEKVKFSFYWPGLKGEVENYCQTCDHCTAKKQPKGPLKAPLGEYTVGEPMERVAMDILGPLPLTKSGHRFILVISDCFT